MNRFGTGFRIEIWGASHTPRLGIRIEGIPAGVELSPADFERDILRRKAGASGTTMRHESDIPVICGGVSDGITTGQPVEISFANEDVRSQDYETFSHHPRPSHADFVARVKYGDNVDSLGGGIFSGRMTLPLVAAGVVAKKLCPQFVFATSVVEIGGSRNEADFGRIVADVAAAGDSVGGVVECSVSGAPVGLGEPFFDSTESIIAHLLFSIPAVKGVEFGSGFEGVRLRGSERNDCIINAQGGTLSNNEGGIVGGITNGNNVVVRVAIKPPPSIAREQPTYDFATGRIAPLSIKGRHDACIVLRAGVVVESVVAIALADLMLQRV